MAGSSGSRRTRPTGSGRGVPDVSSASTCYHLGALTLLTLRNGRVAGLTSFLAPLVLDGFEICSALTDESAPVAVS